MEIPPFGLSMYQKGGTTLLDYGCQKAVNLVGLLLRMRLFVPPARIPALANTGFVDVPIAVAGLHKAPLKRMELGSCNGAAGIIGHQAGRQAAAYRVLPVGLMFLEQKRCLRRRIAVCYWHLRQSSWLPPWIALEWCSIADFSLIRRVAILSPINVHLLRKWLRPVALSPVHLYLVGIRLFLVPSFIFLLWPRGKVCVLLPLKTFVLIFLDRIALLIRSPLCCTNGALLPHGDC